MNDQKEKICLVIPSLRAGGMERVMCELAEYFSSQSGIEVIMITLGKTDKFYLVPQGVILYEPGFIFNSKLRFLFTLRTILFLRKIIRNTKPVAVLSFGETYNSFVLLSTLLLRRRVFVSDRSKPNKKWGNFHETLRRLLYPQAAGIICQTKYSSAFMVAEIGHTNIRIIPNPVKPFQANHVVKENIILNVGRLIKTKQIDFLIENFARIEVDNWQLWVVGDGPEKASLETLVMKLGIEKKVIFWGMQQNMVELYNKAKIFAFTSRSEGFPNALLEAMSAGLACITLDCIAGPSDLIVDGENGFLVSEGEAAEYRSKLNTLVMDEALRVKFSQAAMLKAKEFHIEKIGNEYLKFMFE